MSTKDNLIIMAALLLAVTIWTWAALFGLNNKINTIDGKVFRLQLEIIILKNTNKPNHDNATIHTYLRH